MIVQSVVRRIAALSATLQAIGGAALVGFQQIGSPLLRTLNDKARDVVHLNDFAGVDATGAIDCTASFTAALASAAKEVIVGPGVYQVDNLAAVAGKRLKFAGADLCTLKIKPASTNPVIVGAAVAGFGMSGVTLDYTGGGAGSSAAAGFFSGCANLTLDDIKTKASKGSGLWLYNCAYAKVSNVVADTSTDWAVLIDGAGTIGGHFQNITCTNAVNRGVMVRGVVRCNFFGVHGVSNGGTALWFLDCLYCNAYGITDYLDAGGDTAVIEGASIGCHMVGITAKQSGGHCASISSSATANPVDCHMSVVYSDGQGESIAVITDQGTGFKPGNCTITQVRGKNCGRVTPSEGFGIANAVGCTIQGSITDTLGTMTYAVREGGAAPSGNRFEVSTWLSGSAGYQLLSSSTSQIDLKGTAGRLDHKATAVTAYNPHTDGEILVFDGAALAAATDCTLALAWPNKEVTVSRPAGGAFALNVKQGAVLLKALNAATWARFKFDGTNWVLIASGAV